MTLVIAKSTESHFYFLADTYSEVPSTGQSFNWFTEPMVKIIRVNEKYVIAFAGNSHLAQECIKQVKENHEVNILEHALSSHQNSDQEVDYIIGEIASKKLYFVKNGKLQALPAGFIGSKSGFEKFQENLANQTQTEDNVHIKVIRQPEGLLKKEAQNYSANLDAFRHTLMENDGTCGGFAVTYVISDEFEGYSPYCTIYRGNLNPEEMAETERFVTVNHQDPYYGGFIISFWGTECTFALFYPFAGFGLTYTGFSEIGIECNTHSSIDGYDFIDLSKELDCGHNAILTWKHWAIEYDKFHKALSAGNLDLAHRYVRMIGAEVLKQLNNNGNGHLTEIDSGLFKGVLSIIPLTVDIEFLNMTTAYLKAQIALNDYLGSDKTAIWKQDLTNWTSLINNFKFQVGTNDIDKLGKIPQ